MAISLGVGVLFATFITLLLVPALYLIVDDVVILLRRGLAFFQLALRGGPEAGAPPSAGAPLGVADVPAASE